MLVQVAGKQGVGGCIGREHMLPVFHICMERCFEIIAKKTSACQGRVEMSIMLAVGFCSIVSAIPALSHGETSTCDLRSIVITCTTEQVQNQTA